jgi:hypothetical protein
VKVINQVCHECELHPTPRITRSKARSSVRTKLIFCSSLKPHKIKMPRSFERMMEDYNRKHGTDLALSHDDHDRGGKYKETRRRASWTPSSSDSSYDGEEYTPVCSTGGGGTVFCIGHCLTQNSFFS